MTHLKRAVFFSFMALASLAAGQAHALTEGAYRISSGEIRYYNTKGNYCQYSNMACYAGLGSKPFTELDQFPAKGNNDGVCVGANGVQPPKGKYLDSKIGAYYSNFDGHVCTLATPAGKKRNYPSQNLTTACILNDGPCQYQNNGDLVSAVAATPTPIKVQTKTLAEGAYRVSSGEIRYYNAKGNYCQYSNMACYTSLGSKPFTELEKFPGTGHNDGVCVGANGAHPPKGKYLDSKIGAYYSNFDGHVCTLATPAGKKRNYPSQNLTTSCILNDGACEYQNEGDLN